MDRKYQPTLCACYIGYICQAIIVNLAPLLFVLFQKEFAISMSQIGFLVTYNFCIQILVDLLGARYADRIGYRGCMIAAHLFAAAGLALLAFLPDLLPNPYPGLLIATTVYAAGGGLLEVVISPIVEALPTNGKSAAMSLLHAFYCWGQALVVILTTVFFAIAGTEKWRILALVWAVLPFANVFLLVQVPILRLEGDGAALPMKSILKKKLFWFLVLLMICAGASELSMAQWASYFAEKGLRVDKALGDILGPCMFALLMGISRTFYGIRGNRIPLRRYIAFSSILCVASYLLAVLAPHPILSLVGCAISGFSVGIMWPGVFSIAGETCPQGGTAMFALLAMAGDVGCAIGPSTVGLISEYCGGNLKIGLLAAITFPVILLVAVQLEGKKKA